MANFHALIEALSIFFLCNETFFIRLNPPSARIRTAALQSRGISCFDLSAKRLKAGVFEIDFVKTFIEFSRKKHFGAFSIIYVWKGKEKKSDTCGPKNACFQITNDKNTYVGRFLTLNCRSELHCTYWCVN